MYGASCTTCPDGAELVKAFEMVKPGEYDAILMDIQMPHMNGYEATKAIRGGRNPLGKTIPIIAMTANAFSDDIQNSMPRAWTPTSPSPSTWPSSKRR